MSEASFYGANGVTEIVAGEGIAISPTGGVGVVTINATYANSGGVVTFNGRLGLVTLTSGDVTTALGFTPANAASLAGLASLTSPTFIGVPRVPTPATSDNGTTIPSTAFVRSAISTYGNAGSVTTLSVATANGFAGTVANPTTTPAITVTTSVTGVLKGNGTAISAAAAGTDYLVPPSGTSLLKANSGGALANATADVDYVTPTGTGTLTNKRISARVGSTTSSATPTINTDDVDIYKLTAQAVDITSFTTNLTGTPTDGQCLIIDITGTAARAITWGASFEASTVALPTTTVTTAMLSVAFMYNSVTSKWRCVGVV